MATASSPCSEAGCHRPRAKRSGVCNYHRNLRAKERDLARWAYIKFKSNVKARRDAAPEWKKGHYRFEITLEQFREWAAETSVLLGRGIYAQSLHIDRIVEELGYVPGNIQVLTNSDNVKKENARRRNAKRVIYDFELAARQRLGAYSCEEEAREYEGKSPFRVVEY